MKRKCKTCGAIFEGQSADTRCPECRKIRPVIWREKTCIMCGKPYKTTATRSFYCPDCREIAKREAERKSEERKRLGKVREIGSTDICVKCGKPYIVDSGMQKYCLDCRKIVAREKALREYHAYGFEQKKKRIAERAIATANFVICGKEFELIGQRSRCCSPECSAVHADRLRIEYRKENLEKARECCREWYRQHGEDLKAKRRAATQQRREEREREAKEKEAEN